MLHYHYKYLKKIVRNCARQVITCLEVATNRPKTIVKGMILMNFYYQLVKFWQESE